MIILKINQPHLKLSPQALKLVHSVLQDGAFLQPGGVRGAARVVGIAQLGNLGGDQHSKLLDAEVLLLPPVLLAVLLVLGQIQVFE